MMMLLVVLGLGLGFVGYVGFYVFKMYGYLDGALSIDQMNELADYLDSIGYFYAGCACNLELPEEVRNSNFMGYYETGFNCLSTDIESDWYEEIVADKSLLYKYKQLIGNKLLMFLIGIDDSSIRDLQKERRGY